MLIGQLPTTGHRDVLMLGRWRRFGGTRTYLEVDLLGRLVGVHHADYPEDRRRHKANHDEHEGNAYDVEDDEQDTFRDLPIIDLPQAHEEETQHGRYTWTLKWLGLPRHLVSPLVSFGAPCPRRPCASAHP